MHIPTKVHWPSAWRYLLVQLRVHLTKCTFAFEDFVFPLSWCCRCHHLCIAVVAFCRRDPFPPWPRCHFVSRKVLASLTYPHSLPTTHETSAHTFRTCVFPWGVISATATTPSAAPCPLPLRDILSTILVILPASTLDANLCHISSLTTQSPTTTY